MAGVDKDFEGEAIPMPNMRVGFLPQEPQLDAAKDVRGNVEEGMGATLALLKRFNEISDRFAEPLEDDEMNEAARRARRAAGEDRRLPAAGRSSASSKSPRMRCACRRGMRT